MCGFNALDEGGESGNLKRVNTPGINGA